jgi:hypothetical protein
MAWGQVARCDKVSSNDFDTRWCQGRAVDVELPRSSWTKTSKGLMRKCARFSVTSALLMVWHQAHMGIVYRNYTICDEMVSCSDGTFSAQCGDDRVVLIVSNLVRFHRRTVACPGAFIVQTVELWATTTFDEVAVPFHGGA